MSFNESSTFTSVTKVFRILIGSVIYAIGIEWFLAPAHLVSGGITGIAMIINLVTDLPVGTLAIIINIPVFLIAFKRYGFKFMTSSLFGMLSIYIAIDLLALFDFHVTTEPFLACIYGGVLTGLGLGIIFTTGATTGGTDVIAKLFREKLPYVNFGSFILGLDALVIVAYAVIFLKFDNAMYTVIAAYVAARLIDMVLYGMSPSKLCHIISEYSDEIKNSIVESLDRGVTVLHGKGAFSGENKQILLCVVKRQQIVEIKKIVKSIDQKAFVIVTDTRDVFGEGFGDINHDH